MVHNIMSPRDDVMEGCLIQREMGISDKGACIGISNGFQRVIPERAASVSLANTFKCLGHLRNLLNQKSWDRSSILKSPLGNMDAHSYLRIASI